MDTPMASRYVVLPIEEYKELLRLQLEQEIKTEYALRISELEDEVKYQRELSLHWFEKLEKAETELKDLKGGEEIA